MQKLNKIIEIPCEESEKHEIESRIRAYLVDKQDYIDGKIQIESDRFEAVDIIIFEGCKDNYTLTKILSR